MCINAFVYTNPALPIGSPFTSVQSANYWSSSSGASVTSAAWGVYYAQWHSGWRR